MLNEGQAEELLDRSNGTLKHLDKIGALGQKIDGNFKKKMNIKKMMQPKDGDEYYECFKKNVDYWRRVSPFKNIQYYNICLYVMY